MEHLAFGPALTLVCFCFSYLRWVVRWWLDSCITFTSRHSVSCCWRECSCTVWSSWSSTPHWGRCISTGWDMAPPSLSSSFPPSPCPPDTAHSDSESVLIFNPWRDVCTLLAIKIHCVCVCVCSCWLSLDGNFIWSFFGPVCLIILLNSFFFIITVCKLMEKFSSLNPDLSRLRKLRWDKPLPKTCTNSEVVAPLTLICSWQGLLVDRRGSAVCAGWDVDLRLLPVSGKRHGRVGVPLHSA